MGTARMRQLIAAVSIKNTDAVTRKLLDIGVLHFINISELNSAYQENLKPSAPDTTREEHSKLGRKIESLLWTAGIEAEQTAVMDIGSMTAVDADKTEQLTGMLERKIEEYREEQRKLQQEILRLEEFHRQMEQNNEQRTGGGSSESAFLITRSGSVPDGNISALETSIRSLPAVLLPAENSENTFVLVYMKRDRDQAERILEQNSWKDSPPVPDKNKSAGHPRESIRKQREELKKRQAELRDAARHEVLNRKDDLLAHWSNLKMHELCASIHGYYGTTGRTAVFSGWVPADKEKEISGGIRAVTGGRCYLEWHDPENAEGQNPEKAPVKFTNPRFLRPFEMLVKNYSVPAYGTLDPTPAVAAAFLIMFGLMFGDAGHGLVLMIAGIAGSLMFRKKSARNLSRLVTYCGASAIAAGILFGSYFGAALFPPLWFDYHGAVMGGHTSDGVIKDIYGILMITVYFGITVIAAGILINIYNRIRKGDWFGLLMDKAGILGGWMYGAGVYTAFYFAGHEFKSLPDLDLLFLILGLPALLFLLKPAAEFMLERQHGAAKRFTPVTLLNFLMEWIVEMLEIFSGYLANTLSFLRVAGLGIAHVSLMAAFFEIAGVQDGGDVSIGGIIILVLGNILVITLEGLSAGIQSLRLNYYEFFTKYFSGNGIAYTPISLKGAA